MIENLLPLDLPPGLFTNGTPFSAKGRWGLGNLVRFFEGTIRPVGGWRRLAGSSGSALGALTGVPRGAIAWRDASSAAVIGVGTTQKLYVVSGGTEFDITPVGFVTGGVDSAPSGTAGQYGKGAYGVSNYGYGSAIAGITPATTWQLDTFGQQLVGVDTTNKKLYVWANATGTPAAQAAGSPSCNAVVTTAERFLVALGAGGDPRLVQWASQQTSTIWTPSASNTAGSFPLSTNGALMAGRRVRGSTLLFTDLDVWSMTYLADITLVYSFKQVGDHCGLIAPNAVAVVDGRAIWMGQDMFYTFDGFVAPLQCEVSDSVFANMNFGQRAKCFAVPFTEFGEVWFFYPSANSTEVDSYVAYSYKENHWTTGSLARTAGATDGPTDFPIMLTANGLFYEHECLSDHTGSVPYVESGPVELDGGNHIMNIHRLVPDEKSLGNVNMTLYTALLPTDTEVANGPYTLTGQTDVRLKARQVRVRFTEAVATAWRIGKMRLGVSASSRR